MPNPRQYVDMARMYHVTSVRNRASISSNGLDWRLMGAAPGIAGSLLPEQEGSFVCLNDGEVDFFLGFDASGDLLDLWAIEGVEETMLVESPDHFWYVPAVIPADRLTLVDQDIAPGQRHQ
jgi:hypothetical protein